MSDRKPLTVEEFELLVSQVIIPNHWHGHEPLPGKKTRNASNDTSWLNALAEVSQVTRDCYLWYIREWWSIRDANNANRLTMCPEDNGTHACPPGLDGALCDYHQEWADEWGES